MHCDHPFSYILWPIGVGRTQCGFGLTDDSISTFDSLWTRRRFTLDSFLIHFRKLRFTIGKLQVHRTDSTWLPIRLWDQLKLDNATIFDFVEEASLQLLTRCSSSTALIVRDPNCVGPNRSTPNSCLTDKRPWKSNRMDDLANTFLNEFIEFELLLIEQ